MAAFKKASFGGTVQKSGGGKAEWVARGYKAKGPGKAPSGAKASSIDTPTTGGNKGISKK